MLFNLFVSKQLLSGRAGTSSGLATARTHHLLHHATVFANSPLLLKNSEINRSPGFLLTNGQ